MRCPFCDSDESKVVDSRDTEAGDAIRRRRECLACERRFTTYERIDEMPLMVVKRDGHQEVFDRDKLLRGLVRACVKRDIPLLRLEQLVDEIENRLRRRPGRPAASAEIGQQALRLLRSLDKVAYVRFASVYRQFDDVEEFQEELNRLEGDVPELEGQERLVGQTDGECAWAADEAPPDGSGAVGRVASGTVGTTGDVRPGRYTARRREPDGTARRSQGQSDQASRDLAVAGRREGA